MPNIRLVIEYNGGAFHGWQIQPNVRTVQAELHKVLETILREKIGCVYSAGRTDAGVHARGQVVNFNVDNLPDLRRLKYAVSCILRPDLSVLQADLVPDEFNARKSAVRRQYSYRILNRDCPPSIDEGRVWYIAGKIDRVKMIESALKIIGEADFSSFRAADCDSVSPVKKIYESELSEDGDLLTFRVVGSGFLKQMVRIIVGTLVDIGRGRLSDITAVLDSRDRQAAGMTAPPHGLYLDWVRY